MTVFTPLKHGVLKWDLEYYLKYGHMGWYSIWNKNSKSCRVYCFDHKKFGLASRLLHRTIMNCPEGMVVDHQFHDTLDNRKENLRICTVSQNAMNKRKSIGSSRFKGVSWHKRDKKWKGKIVHNGRRISLGNFSSEEEAARAYDAKALKLFGEFSCLNFPETTPPEDAKSGDK